MMPARAIHPDFRALLDRKEPELIELFSDLRSFILELHPAANELLYHTHALFAVFSMSEKLGDAYCSLLIYTNHVNLGFNKGTQLPDPHKLLAGTGNLMRHVPVQKASDFRNPKVQALVKAAIAFATSDMDVPSRSVGKTISKIRKR